jgi:transposase
MPIIALIMLCSVEVSNELKRISRSRTRPWREVERVKIILKALEGKTVEETAGELGISSVTVCKWRKRFAQEGIAGLADRPRSGRPCVYDHKATNQAIIDTLEDDTPKGTTVWTGKTVAARLGISKDKVYRFVRELRMRLDRKRSWCVSNDPEYAAKAADVTSLKVNPPEGEIVISVDEKTCIQAREQPCGYVKDSNGRIVIGQLSVYIRHGTTNIFAAYDVKSGKVIFIFSDRKRRVDFLFFMDIIAAHYPSDVKCHVILDNLSIHKKCDEWRKAHPNFIFHFTPTSASYLNPVETCFLGLSRRVLRCGNFKTVDAMKQKISEHFEVHNETAKPYVYRKLDIRGSQLRNTLRNLCN